MKKTIIYIHGKGGSSFEINQYKESCLGFDMVGIDCNEYLPWIVEKQIKLVYEKVEKTYDEIYILANSIGAYFTMYTLQNNNIKKALFISPILDMEQLILNMMNWANVSEETLCEKKEISTDFGETLSWKYLCFVRENPIVWNIPTEILYGEKDNLTSRETVDKFIKNHNAHLTVMENGKHWFHTEEQLIFLNNWLKQSL